MKKNKQGSRTRVTVKNTTERRESRRHDQKETLFFDIKSLFTPRRGKKLKTNRYMLQTSIIVVALFLGLIGYVVKFTLKDSSSVAQSSYNKRNSSLSDQTKRGQILSANQKILAYSRIMKLEMRYGTILTKICLHTSLDIPVMERQDWNLFVTVIF